MDSHSRMVQLLKVLLPLTALTLLSTMFLLSRGTTPNATIPFAERELAERTAGQQVTGPFFSGTTARGEAISVMARLARPGSANSPAMAEDLRAEIKFQDGRKIILNSDLGTVRLDQDIAVFTDNVVITSTGGLRITTDELITSLNDVAGNTPGAITGSGPIGEFQAGSLEFGAKNKDEPVHMVFKGGVKLIYDPQKPER